MSPAITFCPRGQKPPSTLSQREDAVTRARQTPLWQHFLQKADRVHETQRLLPLWWVGAGRQRYLDLGCGLGYAALLWKQHYGARAHVVAADLSPVYLLDTAWVASFARLDIARVACDARTLPFPANHFDAVWTGQVLYRCWPPDAAIREIQRVLKPGGRWVGLENATPRTARAARRFATRYTGRQGRPVTLGEWRNLAWWHGLRLAFVPGRWLPWGWARRLLSLVRPVHITMSWRKPE